MASPVVIFICCLTKLYLDCISTHHPKVKLLDGKLQTSQTGCKSLLLSNRRQQLNCEQALQSYCPVFSGSIRYTLSGHPMFGEPTIISCFFRNMSLYNSNIKVVGGKSLSISWLSYSNIGPCNASGTRSACPTFTRVANVGSPGTAKNWGITTEARHGAHVKLPL